ncbi:hypothetical protein C0Q44_11105 [Paenibacillus sp. PCH8]|uniref:helix-turn-helix domain-containing protein n=1 Tax=Paenibacillus sp. PCH8 TaxID=2066524 RepID=UPI000CF8871F|nr:AraC family transcriptional regulator [Paenibacillus sp. PCH8]PQP85014.1 hypothetical protein C0Q44_11105 [Paenibacillus sp. PCH8]
MDFQLRSVVLYDMVVRDKKHLFDLSLRRQIAIFEVMDSLEISVFSKTVQVKAGAVLLANKIRLQNYDKSVLRMRGIIFGSDLLERLPSCHILNETDSEHYDLAISLLNRTIETKEDIERAEKDFLEVYSSYYQTNLANLIRPETDREDSVKRSLVLICKYIQNNYEKPITLQFLADMVGYNPVYLCNLFSKVFNVSPLKYLQQIRVDKAQEYVTTTDLPISEITKKLGYSSSTQFSAMYKKKIGKSPTEHRNQSKNSTVKFPQSIQST